MSEMDEMRKANAPAIKEANSTKTLSGGSLQSKAKSSAADKRADWEKKRDANAGSRRANANRRT